MCTSIFRKTDADCRILSMLGAFMRRYDFLILRFQKNICSPESDYGLVELRQMRLLSAVWFFRATYSNTRLEIAWSVISSWIGPILVNHKLYWRLYAAGNDYWLALAHPEDIVSFKSAFPVIHHKMMLAVYILSTGTKVWARIKSIQLNLSGKVEYFFFQYWPIPKG